MKRILTTLLTVIITTGLFAQQPVKTYRDEMPVKMTEFKFNHTVKAKQTSDWFNYMRELMNLVSSMPYYRNYLFPDSTVRAEFGTGIGYVWTHSLGQVLDPTSNYFLLESPKISKDAAYTLDSVAIPYRYRRVQSGPPDTLIIQVFSHDQLTFVPNPSWTVPKSYARANYDYVARKGDSPVMEIKVLLDDSDTITAAQGIIQEAIGIPVDPDEKIAVAFTYMPGNPYNVDDTIDFYMATPAMNPINAFIFYTARDESVTIDNNYYNHSMMVTSEVRYNVSTNGWNGKYIPGVAFTSGNYHSDVFFRLTYDDYTGINGRPEEDYVKISPNPASTSLRLDYNIGDASKISLEMINLLGNVVYETTLDTDGNTHVLDVSNWSEGVYFSRIRIDGVVLNTTRVIVTR